MMFGATKSKALSKSADDGGSGKYKSTMPDDRAFLRMNEFANSSEEALHHYPTNDEMRDYFGPRFDAVCLDAQQVQNLASGGKPALSKYPKNPDKDLCIPFERRQECERFEETGWCPFHHPYDDPNAVYVTEEARQWLQAAKDSDTEWLSHLLAQGFDIHTIAEPAENIKLSLTGRTALAIAAINGHAEAVALLLEHKARLHHSGREIEQCPPIFDAAAAAKGARNKGVLKAILAAKADINELDPVTGDSLLHVAVNKKHDTETITFLIELGADPNTPNHNEATPLHIAVLGQAHDAVRVLLQARAEPNTQAIKGALAGAGVGAPAPGGSPMGAAVKKQDLEMVKMLIEAGARIDANAVGEAFMLNGREIEDYLVDEKGARPDTLNLDGSSPLHVCAKEKDPTGWTGLNECLGWYENAGIGDAEVWVNVADQQGITPMMVAARQPRVGAAQVLLEWRANVDLQDHEGNTALHHTEELINMGPILKVLVHDGRASTDIVNKKGQKPQLPIEKGCPMQ